MPYSPTFLDVAEACYTFSLFDEWERDYKLEVAKALAEARSSLDAGNADWPRFLRDAFRHPQNNLVDWRLVGDFLAWCDRETDEVRAALSVVWDEDLRDRQRVDGFCTHLPSSIGQGRGTGLNLASLLSGAIDATRLPVARITLFEQTWRAVPYPPAPSDASAGRFYEVALRSLDDISDRLFVERDVRLRDRLDAQGLVWSVFKWPLDGPPFTEWTDELRRAVERLRA